MLYIPDILMDFESVARKLYPLMPEDVSRWLSVRDISDPGMRSLIEKHILSLAHKKLGDFRNRILLSLPPEKTAKGGFRLGTVCYEQEKWPFGLSGEELGQHLAIYGRSGAGKTNLAFNLLKQLTEKKVNWLFLDWKRTARHMLPSLPKRVQVYTPGRSLSPFVFNPFVLPPGLEERTYINYLVDVMASAYTLGDGAKSLLEKTLSAVYSSGNKAPGTAHLIEELNKIPDKERVRSWKITLKRALESLAFSEEEKGNLGQSALAKKLLHSNTIVELDGLSNSSKKFLTPILLLWIYNARLATGEREKLRLVVFIEEAHHVLYRQENRSKESTLNMLLRQCRELGIGIVIIDQHCHLISAAALGNCFTSICLNQKDPSDINRAASLSLVPESEKKFFSQLPVGQAIVKLQDRWRHPFLIKTSLMNINKGAVTDEVLKKYLSEGQMADSALSSAEVPRNDGFEQFHLPDYPLSRREFDFLKDVLAFPDDGVKERYARLGVSAGAGNKTKSRMLSQGWLSSQTLSLGQTRKLLLRVSPAGKQLLGIDKTSRDRTPEYAGMVHEYWKRHYARRLSEQGYQITVEAERRNGRVDLLAQKGNRRIAVEIETGKSDFVGNVKHCLLSGFSQIWIIATDQNAFNKIEQKLLRSHLLIRGKVFLIQAGRELPFAKHPL